MEQQKVWDPLRKKAVALTPEEMVRQWFIGVLKERMKVPEYMMMSEVAMKFGGKDFRADILVYGRDTAPLMVVECKREDVPMSREVLEQALRVYQGRALYEGALPEDTLLPLCAKYGLLL